jgi:hypothetical protein
MDRFKNIVMIVLGGAILTSCLYEKTTVPPDVLITIPEINPNTGQTDNKNLNVCSQTAATNTKDSVCFNSQILPFFVTNCAQSGCHDIKTRAEGYDLTTFKSITSKGIDLKNPSNSKLYREMLGNMPPKPAAKLLKAQTDLVLKWITEGAKNVVCSSSIDTTNITFSKTINPLLQTNCVGCHKAGSVSGGVLLDSYANVKGYIDNKKIWGSINFINGYAAMPPSQKMNDCQLVIVKKWIDAGAKND